MTMSRAGSRRNESLVRAIGTFGLAAGIINITIGGGIFRLPANVAGSLGPAAPIAYLVCAVAMALIVLCIADAGQPRDADRRAVRLRRHGVRSVRGIHLRRAAVDARHVRDRGRGHGVRVEPRPARAGARRARRWRSRFSSWRLAFWSLVNLRGVTLGGPAQLDRHGGQAAAAAAGRDRRRVLRRSGEPADRGDARRPATSRARRCC